MNINSKRSIFIVLFISVITTCMEEQEELGFIFEKQKNISTEKSQAEADLEKLRAIVIEPNTLQHQKGYYFIKANFMQGKRNKQKLPNLAKLDQQILNEKSSKELSKIKKARKKIFNELTQNYKIHLMPKSKEQLFFIIQKILHVLANNEKLQKTISQIKVLFPLDFYGKKSSEEIVQALTVTDSKTIAPIIVIYPTSGKKSAQYVLDEIYNLFGTQEGLDIAPRFNEQVTSLIYFAQGDADFKTSEYKNYYEPSRVYYKHPQDKTDYHLRNPRKK